jgi:hypothetical protein
LREGLTSHSYPSRASLWTEISTGSTLPSYNTQSKERYNYCYVT